MQAELLRLSEHCEYRINTRGITKAMMITTLKYGELVQDCYILNRRQAQKQLDLNRDTQRKFELEDDPELSEDNRQLLKIIDKGGVVVVEAENMCLTAYNFDSRHWGNFHLNYANRKMG